MQKIFVIVYFTCLVLLSKGALGSQTDQCYANLDKWQDEIGAVSLTGDIALKSGTTARLSAVHWPRDEASRVKLIHYLKKFYHQPITIAASSKDRWGARAAFFTLDETMLQVNLLSSGLVMLSDNVESFCDFRLKDSEANARAGKAGLWQFGQYGPYQAQDIVALTQQKDHFVLVEGQIFSIGERRNWTYLNFSRKWEQTLTIKMSKKVWRQMQTRIETQNIHLSQLPGKKVVVRGWVEGEKAPMITLSNPDALDIIK